MKEERGTWGRVRGEAAEFEKGEEGVKGTLQDSLAETNPRASSQCSFVFWLS